jgi:hypothetical protein
MSDIRLSQLTSLSTPASGDLFLVNDISDTTQSASGSTKSITFANLLQDYALEADLTTLSGSLTTHISDTTTHGTTGDIVGTSDIQTLTNKTLTSPKINENVSLTSTASELNTLDGFTGVLADLNNIVDLGDAWTSFTPAWSGITEGSGANVGAYKLIGKTVVGYASFTVAADSTVGATSLALPVTAATNIAGGSFPIGFVVFEDSGTGYFQGLWIAAGEIRVSKSDATYVSIAAISSTVPMTWTTGDKIRVNFCYESA